jgi:hypothetical protein
MSDLHLPDSLTERIQAIAERENRSVEDVVARMIQHYPTQPDAPQEEKSSPDPLLGLIGLLDDEFELLPHR